MANQKVTIEVDAATAKFLADWRLMQNAIRQVGEEGGRAGDRFNKSGKNAADGFASVARAAAKATLAVAGIGTAFSAINTAIGFIRAEAERLQRVGRMSQDVRVARGAALVEAETAFAGTLPERGAKQLLSRVAGRINERTGVTQTVALRALRDLAGTTGGLLGGPEELGAIPETVGLTYPSLALEQNEGEFREVVRAVGNMMKARVLAGQQPLNAEQTVSGLMRALRAAPSQTAQQFGPKAAEFLIQAGTVGHGRDTFAQSMGILTAVQQATADEEGRRAVTNLLSGQGNLFEEIVKRAPSLRGKKLGMDELRRMVGTAAPGTELASVRAHFLGGLDPRTDLQNLVDERGNITGTIGGEARSKAIQASIFIPGTDIWNLIEKNQEFLRDALGPEAVGQMRRLQESFRTDPELADLQQGLKGQRTKDVGADARLAENFRERINATLEERLELTSKSVAETAARGVLNRARRLLQADPEKSARLAIAQMQKDIEELQTQLRTGTRRVESLEVIDPINQIMHRMMRDVPLKDEDRGAIMREIPLLESLIDRLDTTLKVMMEQQKRDAELGRQQVKEAPARDELAPRGHPAQAVNE